MNCRVGGKIPSPRPFNLLNGPRDVTHRLDWVLEDVGVEQYGGGTTGMSDHTLSRHDDTEFFSKVDPA